MTRRIIVASQIVVVISQSAELKILLDIDLATTLAKSINEISKELIYLVPTGSKMGREKKCTNANCPWNSVLPLFFFLLSFYFLLFLL